MPNEDALTLQENDMNHKALTAGPAVLERIAGIGQTTAESVYAAAVLELIATFPDQLQELVWQHACIAVKEANEAAVLPEGCVPCNCPDECPAHPRKD